MRARRMATTLASMMMLCGAAAPQAQSSPELPDGPGAAVARAACSGCHDAALISDQHLSTAGWDREIAKMERWGAKVATADRPMLVEYVSRHFGLSLAASHVEPDQSGAGQAVYEKACRTCHADDLSEQQRLTEAAWTRTVRKMVGWGAQVPPADERLLVAYLASRWGPRLLPSAPR